MGAPSGQALDAAMKSTLPVLGPIAVKRLLLGDPADPTLRNHGRTKDAQASTSEYPCTTTCASCHELIAPQAVAVRPAGLGTYHLACWQAATGTLAA